MFIVQGGKSDNTFAKFELFKFKGKNYPGPFNLNVSDTVDPDPDLYQNYMNPKHW